MNIKNHKASIITLIRLALQRIIQMLVPLRSASSAIQEKICCRSAQHQAIKKASALTFLRVISVFSPTNLRVNSNELRHKKASLSMAIDLSYGSPP
ncbi:MAG: hypothetical protein MJZ51_07605 [Bacteroidales bacterium]|nr:hypothetical protein [Bacteroidales bacterium]